MSTAGVYERFDISSLPNLRILPLTPPLARSHATGGVHVPPLTDTLSAYSCLKASSTAVIVSCGPWNDYSLKYVRVLAELCHADYNAADIAAAAKRVCSRKEIL